MEKLDLRKELKHLYNPSAKAFQLIDVPSLQFVMIDGQGDPNTAESFRLAMEALYTVAYTLKFDLKKNHGVDYPVMPLEGLWWAEDMELFSQEKKGEWKWTLMIMHPDVVTKKLFKSAVEQVAAKKGLPALGGLRLERLREGTSAQILYLGPYAGEGPTIARMHAFIRESGYLPEGKHHEIYLGDPRRSAPEKLKTVIRQPAKRQGKG
jgi:hypothetical protein